MYLIQSGHTYTGINFRVSNKVCFVRDRIGERDCQCRIRHLHSSLTLYPSSQRCGSYVAATGPPEASALSPTFRPFAEGLGCGDEPKLARSRYPNAVNCYTNSYSQHPSPSAFQSDDSRFQKLDSRSRQTHLPTSGRTGAIGNADR